MGNVIISVPLSYNPEKDSTTGRLIDLDHAKLAQGVQALYQPRADKIPPETDQTASIIMQGFDKEFARMFYHRLLEDIDTPPRHGLQLPYKIVEYAHSETGRTIAEYMQYWRFMVTSFYRFPYYSHL